MLHLNLRHETQLHFYRISIYLCMYCTSFACDVSILTLRLKISEYFDRFRLKSLQVTRLIRALRNKPICYCAIFNSIHRCTVGRGGALVESKPFDWRVVGSNPALAVT